jgi:hypothetical protein
MALKKCLCWGGSRFEGGKGRGGGAGDVKMPFLPPPAPIATFCYYETTSFYYALLLFGR